MKNVCTARSAEVPGGPRPTAPEPRAGRLLCRRRPLRVRGPLVSTDLSSCLLLPRSETQADSGRVRTKLFPQPVPAPSAGCGHPGLLSKCVKGGNWFPKAHWPLWRGGGCVLTAVQFRLQALDGRGWEPVPSLAARPRDRGLGGRRRSLFQGQVFASLLPPPGLLKRHLTPPVPFPLAVSLLVRPGVSL